MESKEEITQRYMEEIIEYALQEHRKGKMPEEECEDRERVKNLAEQVELCLNSLPEEKRDLIDDYISAIRSVDHWDYKALLIYGFREGIKFKKWENE